MAMKRLIFAALCLGSFVAKAATIGPGCSVAWDYPPADLDRIDGFRIYVDGTQTAQVPKDQQQISCANLHLQQGKRTLEASAYNAMGESAKSDPLAIVFVDSAPGKPANVRVVVSLP
jgi:hypothetical protein